MTNSLKLRRQTRQAIKTLIRPPGSDEPVSQFLASAGLSMKTEAVDENVGLGYRVTLSNGQGQVWEGVAVTIAWALSIALCQLIGTLTTNFWERKVNHAFLHLVSQKADANERTIAVMGLKHLDMEDIDPDYDEEEL